MDLLKIKDLKDLQAILDLMRRNDLAELELEEEGQRIRLRKSEPHAPGVVYAGEAPALAGIALPAAAGAPAGPPAAEADDPLSDLDVITSPLVGTFYRAPSPEDDPFVQEGDRVTEDSLLAIVEAMKVMNEIRAGKSGVIREALVKNGQPVEFGQAIFRIDTAD